MIKGAYLRSIDRNRKATAQSEVIERLHANQPDGQARQELFHSNRIDPFRAVGQRIWIGDIVQAKLLAKTGKVVCKNIRPPLPAQLASGTQMHHEQQYAKPQKVSLCIYNPFGPASVRQPVHLRGPIGKEVPGCLQEQLYRLRRCFPLFLPPAWLSGM